ncbi:MAG: hypothetical protein V4487_09100 [Chlamydiota bacterium]
MSLIVNKVFNSCYDGISTVATQVSDGLALGAQKTAQFIQNHENITAGLLGLSAFATASFLSDEASTHMIGLTVGVMYKAMALKNREEDLKNKLTENKHTMFWQRINLRTFERANSVIAIQNDDLLRQNELLSSKVHHAVSVANKVIAERNQCAQKIGQMSCVIHRISPILNRVTTQARDQNLRLLDENHRVVNIANIAINNASSSREIISQQLVTIKELHEEIEGLNNRISNLEDTDEVENPAIGRIDLSDEKSNVGHG